MQKGRLIMKTKDNIWNSSKIFLVLVSGLMVTINALAMGTCNNELRETATINAIDAAAQQFTIRNFSLQVNASSRLVDAAGNDISFNQLILGEDVDVRYCSDTSPFTAIRVDQLAAAPGTPPPVGILNLNVPLGTESQPVSRIFGETAHDQLGYPDGSMAYGDINGDGYDDLVIGSGRHSDPAKVFSGAVYVVYGSAQLPTPAFDLSLNEDTLDASVTRIYADDNTEFLGRSIASADVDADGFDDIIIGSSRSNLQGRVFVVYGSQTLPGTAVDLNTDTVHTVFTTEVDEQSLGNVVASTDINGDGFADVIISAPDIPNNLALTRDAGIVYVAYGNANLRGQTVIFSSGETTSVNGETKIFGVKTGDRFGGALATGDINGDGYYDVIVGAPRANTFFTTDRGEAYVIYGSASLPNSVVDLSASGDAIGAARETRIPGRVSNSLTGAAVASGDFNGDGYDDIAITAPGIKGAGDNFAVGEAYLFYGSPDIPGQLLNISFNSIRTFGETWITATEEFGGFGRNIALADINGDGLDDIIAGAPGSVPLGGAVVEFNNVNDGAVYVIYGRTDISGQQLIDPREVANLIVTADDPDEELGTNVVAGGDLDRNGLPEYSAVAKNEDNPLNVITNDATGSIVTVFSETAPQSVTRIEHSTAGDAPKTNFGPVVRAMIDYSAGALASTDTVTLTRTLLNTGAGTALQVNWTISTDRSDVSADITFKYTDAELLAAHEENLKVYTSLTGATGSWTLAGASQTLNMVSNAITVVGASESGLFVIVDKSVNPLPPNLEPVADQPASDPESGATVTDNSNGTGSGILSLWLIAIMISMNWMRRIRIKGAGGIIF